MADSHKSDLRKLRRVVRRIRIIMHLKGNAWFDGVGALRRQRNALLWRLREDQAVHGLIWTLRRYGLLPEKFSHMRPLPQHSQRSIEIFDY